MNIFYLDKNLNKCAQYHCDKHVVKMILEYSQILSTSHRVLDGIYIETKINNRKTKIYQLSNEILEQNLYKATHINHPCNIWIRLSKNNYLYLFNLLTLLLNEYELRYNKTHKCKQLLTYLKNPPNNISNDIFTEPPQCMPDDCKVINNSIEAYRNYYKQYKMKFAVWKNTLKPYWI